MPRNRPSIRDWMNEYNRLAQIATARGLAVREYRNLRTSNDEARARVESLAARLGVTLLIGANAGQVPTPTGIFTVRPVVTPRIRTLRPRRRRVPAWAPAPAVPAFLQVEYPVDLQFDDLMFGVEIEASVPNARTNVEIAAELTNAGLPCYAEHYNHHRRGHWKIVSDGSVTAHLPNYRGQFELVAPPIQGRDLERQIKIACEVLQRIGATVNRSCGLHVHIGVAPSIDNVGFFRDLVNLYYVHDKHMNSVVSPSRRANHYCKAFSPTMKFNIDRCTTVGQVISCATDRFMKLNLASYSRHRTVEFRQHQGTIEADKIVNWARLCARLVIAAAKGTQAVETDFAGFLNAVELSDSEQAFFKGRYDRFHGASI